MTSLALAEIIKCLLCITGMMFFGIGVRVLNRILENMEPNGARKSKWYAIHGKLITVLLVISVVLVLSAASSWKFIYGEYRDGQRVHTDHEERLDHIEAILKLEEK